LIPEVQIFGQFSKMNKMSRILAQAGLIKHYFYFPVSPNPTLQAYIDQVTALLKDSKDKDDAPDSLAGLSAYLEKYMGLFKN